MSTTLTSKCPVCDQREHLLKCQGCKVMMYCGRDHQTVHRPSHKRSCNAVKNAKESLDEEERRLRALPGDIMTPENVFEEAVGRFWGIYETRPYMRARYALVEATLKIKTRHAVQSAFDHVIDLIRLCRSDNMGVRDLATFLFLRLGKDQECYDFIKWYATTGTRGDYDWGDMDLGFLDVKDADVFEAVSLYTGKYFGLSHAVSVTLIKIRLLHDLKSLQSATAMGDVVPQVPQEILDNIRNQLVSTVVSGNKEIMDRRDQAPAIAKLEAQIAEMYKAVEKTNPYFWPALVHPGNNLNAPPSAYTMGSREEMQLVLKHAYDAWDETPGAIDMIREQTNLAGH